MFNPAVDELSFTAFLKARYRLSGFLLPLNKPKDDSLDTEDKENLLNLIEENDHYEIQHIIKERYD